MTVSTELQRRSFKAVSSRTVSMEVTTSRLSWMKATAALIRSFGNNAFPYFFPITFR